MSVASQTLPLELLTAGEQGIVAHIEGDPGLVNRLEEMGLRSGTRVRMIRPGSPCILDVHHQRFSFRLDDHVTVFVEVM